MFKQTLAAFIASLALNTAAAAQTDAAPPTPTQTAPATAPQLDQALAARTCELPKIADTAPLEPVSGSDLMTVPVAVNGTNRQFLLDLALNKPTEMSPSLMAELGLPEYPKFGGSSGSVGGTGTGMGGGASFTSSGFVGAGGMGMPYCDVESGMGCWLRDTKVRVNSFTVGNATGHHLQFLTAKQDDIAGSAPYEGLLTGDFFRHYDVELDFAGKQVTWLTPTKCIDPNQVVFWSHRAVAIIPVQLADDGRQSMTGMVRGHLINAEIDTSSPRTVMRRDIAELYVGLKDKDMPPWAISRMGCTCKSMCPRSRK